MSSCRRDPPCAGIVVLHGTKTILVATPRRRYSFPKGKREKGEDSITAAWRELQEETGLTSDQVNLLTSNGELIHIDEVSDKGYPAVRYFIGRVSSEIEKLTFDDTELASAGWYEVNEAMDKRKLARKTVLRIAILHCLTELPAKIDV